MKPHDRRHAEHRRRQREIDVFWLKFWAVVGAAALYLIWAWVR
jgi:hypothetical protein